MPRLTENASKNTVQDSADASVSESQHAHKTSKKTSVFVRESTCTYAGANQTKRGIYVYMYTQ